MAEPKTLGKYEIQSVLGKGAMGVVYKAFDPHIERTVAIKTVRKELVDPDLAQQFMARFKNEAKAAGRLHIRTSSASTSTARTIRSRSSRWSTSTAPDCANT